MCVIKRTIILNFCEDPGLNALVECEEARAKLMVVFSWAQYFKFGEKIGMKTEGFFKVIHI